MDDSVVELWTTGATIAWHDLYKSMVEVATVGVADVTVTHL